MACNIVGRSLNIPAISQQGRFGLARGQATPSVPSACALPSTSGRQAPEYPVAAYLVVRRRNRRASAVAANATGKRNSSSVSNSLIAVLKDEIKYERESYRRSDLIVGDPPSDFGLQDARGTTWFVLAKEFGNEEIIVRVDLEGQPDFDEDEEGGEYENKDDEDDDEDSVPVLFQVTIAKDGDDTLVFECESDGEYLTINRVALESLYEDNNDGPPVYKGPVFQDLDDTLQQAFVDFLEERGVNAYLGEYIRVYLEDKATLEYQQWLNRVREFIGR